MEEISMDKRDFEDILNDHTSLPINTEEWRERFRTIVKTGGCIWLFEPDGTISYTVALNAEGQLVSVPIT